MASLALLMDLGQALIILYHSDFTEIVSLFANLLSQQFRFIASPLPRPPLPENPS